PTTMPSLKLRWRRKRRVQSCGNPCATDESRKCGNGPYRQPYVTGTQHHDRCRRPHEAVLEVHAHSRVAVMAETEARTRHPNAALTRVGPEGIQPSTRGLKVRCSTTELQARARLPASQTILAASGPAAGRAAPGPGHGSSTARRPRRRRRSSGPAV